MKNYICPICGAKDIIHVHVDKNGKIITYKDLQKLAS